MAAKNLSHESFDRKEKIKLPSDKKFGFTFTIIFFILAVAPILISARMRFIFLLLCSIFLACSLLKPEALNTVNYIWARFGILLNKLVSPVILSLLYCVAFVPMGLLLRVFQKDILSLKLNKKAKSYWIDSPKNDLSSMKDQF
jgi:hypothetical protein